MSQYQNAVSAHSLIAGVGAGAAASCFLAYQFQRVRFRLGRSGAGSEASSGAGAASDSALDRAVRSEWFSVARLAVCILAVVVKALFDVVSFFSRLSDSARGIWLSLTGGLFILLTGISMQREYVTHWGAVFQSRWGPIAALSVLGAHLVTGIVAAALPSAQLAIFLGVQAVDFAIVVGLSIFGSCRRMMRVKVQFAVCAVLIVATDTAGLIIEDSRSAIYVDRYFVIDICYDVCLVLLMLQQVDGLQLLRDTFRSLFGSQFRSDTAPVD